MTTEQKAEMFKQKIKDLEWAEDYHERKLAEASLELEMFREQLKSLDI